MFRDLGQLQIGTVHDVGLTAAFGRTDWITVTGIVQPGVLRTFNKEKNKRKLIKLLLKCCTLVALT